jgi:hypothetical protein
LLGLPHLLELPLQACQDRGELGGGIGPVLAFQGSDALGEPLRPPAHALLAVGVGFDSPLSQIPLQDPVLHFLPPLLEHAFQWFGCHQHLGRSPGENQSGEAERGNEGQKSGLHEDPFRGTAYGRDWPAGARPFVQSSCQLFNIEMHFLRGRSRDDQGAIRPWSQHLDPQLSRRSRSDSDL